METKTLSWSDVESNCMFIKGKMDKDGYKPDVIIGLLRGGVIPARIFADYFNILVDFFAIDVKLYDGIGVRKETPIIKPFHFDIDDKKKVLILDDIFDSGKTMDAVLNLLKGRDIKTATLYWRKSAEKKPDYYAVEVDTAWITFPWEKHEFSREVLDGKN